MSLRSGPMASRLVLEMVVIVFSVVLGFAINEWRQSAARSATVATVLDAVREEVTANRAQLEPALEYHTDLLRDLRSGGRVVARIDLTRTPLDTTSAAGFARTLHAAMLEDPRFRGDDAPPLFNVERVTSGRWRILAEPEQGPGLITFEGDTAFVRAQGISLHSPFLVEFGWETAQATQAAAYMSPSIVAAMARARQLHRGVEDVVDHIVSLLYSAIGLDEGNYVGALADLVSYEASLLQVYDSLLVLLPDTASRDSVPPPPEPDSVLRVPEPEP